MPPDPVDTDPSFIPKVNFTRRYIAPGSIIANETRCRTLQIPIDDNGQIEAAIAEVLGYLANPLSWQEVTGSLNSFDVSSAISQMLYTLFLGECGDDLSGDTVKAFLVRHKENQNANGGSTSNDTYNKHTLNEEVYDPDNFVSLSGGDVTIVAGTYLLFAKMACYRPNANHAAIYSVTAGSRLFIGQSGYSDAALAVTAHPVALGFVVLANPTVFRLEVYTQTGAGGNGLGVPSNKNVEEYAFLLGLKLA